MSLKQFWFDIAANAKTLIWNFDAKIFKSLLLFRIKFCNTIQDVLANKIKSWTSYAVSFCFSQRVTKSMNFAVRESELWKRMIL